MIARLFLIMLLVVGQPATAQSVKLKAHEIEALLTGNTAVGKFDGTSYLQYFDPHGKTIYLREGGRSLLGEWRVNNHRDEYQQIWINYTDWDGLFVMEYAADYYWVSKSTPPTPFTVVQGQQLIADAIADATPFCEGIERLAKTLRRPVDVPDQTFALPEHLARQRGCKQSLNADGGKSLHCSWAFPYRAEDATQAFETIVERTSACGPHTLSKDQNVNHPDFYDLRLFEYERGTIGVSLKDKGALQQTLVFLTFTPR